MLVFFSKLSQISFCRKRDLCFLLLNCEKLNDAVHVTKNILQVADSCCVLHMLVRFLQLFSVGLKIRGQSLQCFWGAPLAYFCLISHGNCFWSCKSCSKTLDDAYTTKSCQSVKCGWLLRAVWWPWQNTILTLTLCFEGGRSYPPSYYTKFTLVQMGQLQSWILKREVIIFHAENNQDYNMLFFLSSSHWIDHSCFEGSLRRRENVYKTHQNIGISYNLRFTWTLRLHLWLANSFFECVLVIFIEMSFNLCLRFYFCSVCHRLQWLLQ